MSLNQSHGKKFRTVTYCSLATENNPIWERKE